MASAHGAQTTWNVVRGALVGAAESKNSKGFPLSTMLYVPEVFSVEDKFAIDTRRREATVRATASNKQLMVVIAEVKALELSLHGERVVCKHLPNWHFYIDADLSKRLHRNFERDIEMWERLGAGHLILCATFELSRAENPNLRELTLMPVTEQWLPYESATDRALIEQCVEAQRHFVKGMRMNLSPSDPIASIILTDTKPRATALYLRSPMSDEASAILQQRMAYAGTDHLIIAPGEALPVAFGRS